MIASILLVTVLYASASLVEEWQVLTGQSCPMSIGVSRGAWYWQGWRDVQSCRETCIGTCAFISTWSGQCVQYSAGTGAPACSSACTTWDSTNSLCDGWKQEQLAPPVQIPFSIKFGGQAWGMAKSLDNGQTWTPIATVDMHTYQHTHMIGEVRGQAQPGMMLKFQPLHTSLAQNLGYHCPYMHQKCDGTCTFDEGRNFQCFNWDSARIFLHEFKINGRVLDFSSASAMKAGGWTLDCRSPRTSCTPPIQIVNRGTSSNAGSQFMVRQDGPDFYYTYTFGSTIATESPTLAPTFNPTKTPTRNPSSSPTHNPTRNPSNNPTSMPTRSPSSNPTSMPTPSPSSNPTSMPTSSPSSNPTHNPTKNPSNNPTRMPTANPTNMPTGHPTLMPTSNPSKPPTAADYIIKVKGFHGNPAQILDAAKIHSQPKVDVELFDFERKIAPATRRLLRQLQNSET